MAQKEPGGDSHEEGHSPEQVVRKLREADGLLAEGVEVADVCRLLEVSNET
jgi:hypothetical protein